MKRTIRVRAGNGIKMPIHPTIAMDTSETHFTDSVEVDVVADHPFTRRCLRNGDLVEVKGTRPAAAGDTSPRSPETAPAKGRKE